MKTGYLVQTRMRGDKGNCENYGGIRKQLKKILGNERER
jgi:hypothetical protein